MTIGMPPASPNMAARSARSSELRDGTYVAACSDAHFLGFGFGRIHEDDQIGHESTCRNNVPSCCTHALYLPAGPKKLAENLVAVL
jgi:hypothetical protein